MRSGNCGNVFSMGVLSEKDECEEGDIDDGHKPEHDLERKFGIFVADCHLGDHGAWPAAEQFEEMKRCFSQIT